MILSLVPSPKSIKLEWGERRVTNRKIIIKYHKDYEKGKIKSSVKKIRTLGS